MVKVLLCNKCLKFMECFSYMSDNKLYLHFKNRTLGLHEDGMISVDPNICNTFDFSQ